MWKAVREVITSGSGAVCSSASFRKNKWRSGNPSLGHINKEGTWLVLKILEHGR